MYINSLNDITDLRLEYDDHDIFIEHAIINIYSEFFTYNREQGTISENFDEFDGVKFKWYSVSCSPRARAKQLLDDIRVERKTIEFIPGPKYAGYKSYRDWHYPYNEYLHLDERGYSLKYSPMRPSTVYHGPRKICTTPRRIRIAHHFHRSQWD